MSDHRTIRAPDFPHEAEGPLSQRGETIRDSGLVQRPCLPSTVPARIAHTNAEIAAREIERAYDLLKSAEEGSRARTRAVAAGEARDLYESAMRRIERLRGATQEHDLRQQAWRVRELLLREEDGRTWPP